MKKACDTNIFLSKAAEDALTAISKNSTESKVISSLGSISNSRAPSTKVKIQICLEVIIKKLGEKLLTFKDSSIIMNYITSYIADASEKVRERAKELLNTLKLTLSQKSLEKLIRSTCNDQQEKKISSFYNNSDFSTPSEAATSRTSFVKGKSPKQRRNVVSFYNEPTTTKSELSTNYPLYEISEVPIRKRDFSEIHKADKRKF